jgi:hypothetical protein
MREASVSDRLESDVQRAVIAFYRSFDIEIARFSERRRSMIIRGWPDLGLFCLRKKAFWVHETKRDHGGIQSLEQRRLEEWFTACGIPYLLGGVQAAHDHLINLGILKP